jgi:hypothetical protein
MKAFAMIAAGVKGAEQAGRTPDVCSGCTLLIRQSRSTVT